MHIPNHPLLDMLPEELQENVSEEEGSRFRKKQPPKENGRLVDPDDMISNAMEGKSAWGQQGSYEVP